MRLIAHNLWTYVHGHYPVGLLDVPTSFLKPGCWFSKAYKSGAWDGRIRFTKYDRKTKMWRFPTGLLQSVCDFLDDREYRYELADCRDLPTAEPQVVLHDDEKGEIRLDKGKWDYQAGVVASALSATRGVLKAATGSGKSEMGAAIIKSVGGQWSWLTHRTTLLHQTRKRLAMRLKQPIGILGDQEEDLQDVTVCMAQTLAHVFKKGGREHVRDWCRTCVGIIGDEIHHLESDQWFGAFSQFPAVWRFGLTATPPRSEQGGMYLEAMTGPIVASVSARELIERGVLTPPRIWFIPILEPQVPDPPTPPGQKKKNKIEWPKLYKQAIVENDYRNRRVAEVAAIFQLEGKSSLILVRQLGHGRNILRVLKDRNVPAGWVHGKVPQAERDAQFEQLWSGELATIVAVCETVGEGVDLPELRAVINATGTRGGGSAKEEETGRVTIQVLGRGLRRCPGKKYFEYVDFVDSGHKQLQRASLARIETLEHEGYADSIRYWEDYQVDR